MNNESGGKTLCLHCRASEGGEERASLIGGSGRSTGDLDSIFARMDTAREARLFQSSCLCCCDSLTLPTAVSVDHNARLNRGLFLVSQDGPAARSAAGRTTLNVESDGDEPPAGGGPSKWFRRG